MKNIKRVLSFLLALVLLIGYLPPVHVHAQESESSVEETIAVTEAMPATEPAQETSATTETATEAATEAPTQPTTVPEETAAPAEATVPATEVQEATSASTKATAEYSNDIFVLEEITVSHDIADTAMRAAEDWRGWKQGDSRWGSINLGNSTETMAGVGCLVTSVAKIMVQSGYMNPNSFNPGVLINWLNANNSAPNYSFDGNTANLYWAKPAEMINGFSLKTHDYGISGSSASCESNIVQLVREKYHVILGVGGHYVAVDNAKTLETGKVYIWDTKASVQNVDVLLTSRYSYIYRVALYSGWGTYCDHPTYIQQANDEYLKSAADCTNAAVYYKSCQNCGAAHSSETFTYGSALGHQRNANGECTVCGDNYITSQCQSYPAFGTITITEDCSPYTLPCSDKTASEFGYKSTKLTDYAFKTGDQVEVNGIVCNSEDHYWYNVKLGENKSGWLYCTHAGATETRRPYVSGDIIPDSISGAQALSGKVVTGGAQLDEIWIDIYDANVKRVLGSGVKSWGSREEYTLKGSPVDNDLLLQNLKQHGTATYTLGVYANVTNYWLDENHNLYYNRTCEQLAEETFTFVTSGGSTCSHSYTNKAEDRYLKSAADCDSAAVYYKSCQNCGQAHTSETFTSGSALGHSMTGWTTVKEATCTETGSKQRSCSRCGHTETESISALGHNYVNGTCSACGEEKLLGSGTCGENLTWELDSKGVLTISGSGAMHNYSFQNGAPWDAYKDSILSVVIADGVTSIGDLAFSCCEKLADISIPDSVKYIGSIAFERCLALENIVIPDSVSEIGSEAFFSCGLTSFTIPRGISKISVAMFEQCQGLKSIRIPENITVIEDFAFKFCFSLEEIIFEGDAPAIDGNAWIFFDVGATAYYPANNPTWTADVMLDYGGKITWVSCAQEEDENVIARGICGENLAWMLDKDGKLTISGTGAMEDYEEDGDAPWYDYSELIKSVVIKDGVTSIGDHAFDWCTSLSNVVIADSIVSIGDYAFSNCNSIIDITIPNGVATIGDRAFYGCCSLIWAIIGRSVTSIGSMAFSCCDSLRGFWVEPDNTTYSTDSYGVLFNKNKTELITAPWTLAGSYYIPDSVTTIGSRAFEHCGKLTEVIFGDNVSKIGESAFEFCENLTSITIPDSVTSIGYRAFAVCDNLTSVTIGKNVTHMSRNVFSWCEKLTGIWVNEENRDFSSDSFGVLFNKDKSALICAPGSISGSYSIPEGVSIICVDAFNNCSGLTNVTIPGSVKTIDNMAFYYCDGLTSVRIGNGVETIGENAFDWCSNLTSIVIPDSVETVGYRAFSYCGSLNNVIIGEKVSSIGEFAFCWCDQIDAVYFRGDAPAFVGEDLNHFWNVTTTAYYPSNNPTWTANVMQDYGGTITWVAYALEDDNIIASGACGENLTWKLDSEGLLTISGAGEMPDYIWGSAPWYDYRTAINSLVVEDGVTKIGNCAFPECNNMITIEIPDSMIHIGSQAFQNCTGLTSIEIPDSVTDMGDYALCGCESLTSIKLSAGLKKINRDLLCSCTSLTIIEIPTSVTEIRVGAFYNCSSLEIIVIPDTVVRIGEETFTDCNNVSNVYYGGTARQWADLGENTPTAAYIHFACTDYENHWADNTIERTCTRDGYTCKSCTCGYERNAVITDYAVGHAEIIDKAVEPTCTESGLTEGKHCSVCEEVLTAQIEIPALGHAYGVQNDRVVCNACGDEVYIRIVQDYLAMDPEVFTSAALDVELSNEDHAAAIVWTLEGDSEIVSIHDGIVNVTGRGIGTVEIVATITVSNGLDETDDHYEVYAVSSRCRVDVAENLQLDGIQLSTAKATTELYKNEFATFEILLDLPQNHPVDTLLISDSATNAVAGMENKSNLIESARFTSDAVAELFELVLLDDRTVQIVPTEKALENAKAVKSSYADTVTVTVQGKEYVSEKLTLTVKKTLPKLKATVAAFNSFYSGQTQEIAVTGGTVTSVYENEAKNTAKATAIPNWLTLNEDGTLTLTADAPLKNASGKAYVMVETEEWRIPTALTLSVKNTYKAPSLKLSAATVTMTGLTENSDGVALKLVCSNKKDTLSGLNVTNMTAPAGFVIENFNAEDGSFTLKAAEGFKAGKIALQVHFGDTTVTLPLNLTVKTATAALKLAPTTVTLNQAVSDSGEIKVTSTPADFRPENPAIRLTGTETINGKKTTVDKTASGELDIRYENGYIRIRTTDLTPEKASYKLYISAGGSKEAAATVNVVTAVPGVTLKATGSMDLSFPTQTATITATFKNYSGRIVSYDCTVAEMKGKTVVDEDVTGKFAIEQDGKTFRIRCTDESLNIANTYAVKLKLILEDGSSLEKSINLKVKRTAVKLKLSAAKLSLNKLIGDTGSINITCTTKGYAFDAPVWTLTDSKNKPVEGELTINYKNGQLTVSTNDATVYGKSYKIVLKANEYGTAATLTVSVPTQAKSIPTVTIKAAGKIDVIRDGSAVTVTPTYKNCITTTHAEETVTISNSKKEDVTSLFTITPNGKGGYTVTKAEGAALPTGTYKVKLAANFGAVEIASKEVNMSVAMGAAKLTTVTTDTTLFAKDKNDRALVWFEAGDATLNEVSSITFKNAKQAQMFEIIDYGGGLFAIGFKDGVVDKSLLASGKATSKTVTVSLNVFINGNETTKTNATANVKLTIVK